MYAAVPWALLLARGKLTLVPLVGQTATKIRKRNISYIFIDKKNTGKMGVNWGEGGGLVLYCIM